MEWNIHIAVSIHSHTVGLVRAKPMDLSCCKHSSSIDPLTYPFWLCIMLQTVNNSSASHYYCIWLEVSIITQWLFKTFESKSRFIMDDDMLRWDLYRIERCLSGIYTARKYFHWAVRVLVLELAIYSCCCSLRKHKVTNSTKPSHSYTRLLQKALNISWKLKVPNVELYGGMPRPSTLVTKRRLQLAGHCFRASGTQYQPASDLVFWQSHERFRVGQGNSLTYNRMLRHDTGLELDELQKVALNRDEWRTLCHRATSHW